MTFAKKMQAVNNKLINKFSERVTGEFYLIRPGAKVYNPAIGDYDRGAPTNINITGLSINFSANMVNGTTVQDGDVMIKMTTDVEPLMNDKVFMDGSEWSIVSLPHILYTGASIPISYQMHLRK